MWVEMGWEVFSSEAGVPEFSGAKIRVLQCFSVSAEARIPPMTSLGEDSDFGGISDLGSGALNRENSSGMFLPQGPETASALGVLYVSCRFPIHKCWDFLLTRQ